MKNIIIILVLFSQKVINIKKIINFMNTFI